MPVTVALPGGTRYAVPTYFGPLVATHETGYLMKEDRMEPTTFAPDAERSMVDFMNENYAHSNLMYAQVYGQLWDAVSARLVVLDRSGMELDVTLPSGTQHIRVPFDHHLQDEGDAQSTLVEMSFQAREVLKQRGR